MPIVRNHQDQPNARFWTYVNGWPVKLTLRPGETRHYHRAWTDEEGWTSHALVFTYDGATVELETIYDGVDCDGRMTQTYRDTCPRDRLAAIPPAHTTDEPTPDWIDAGHSQRDYTAEAAGY